MSISGDPAGIRTPDTLLKRQVLCLLSYWVIFIFPHKSKARFRFARRSLRKVEILAHPRRAKIGTCRSRPTWLGWQDSNLQYQSQSLVCYRYTTSHHRLRQRGRHCRPPAFLGWEMGLEPTTPGTTIRCSYQLSYTHHCMEPANGTPGGTRTPGLLLRRQLLYPAELLAHICTRRVLAHSNRGGAPPRKAYLVYHHSAALSRAMLRPRREFFEFFRAGANPQRRRSGSPRSRRRNIQTSTPAAAQASTTSAVSWE